MTPREELQDAAALRGEIAAGRTADDRLARDLNRPRARHAASPGPYLERLEREPSAPGTELVARAQAGDLAARAALIEQLMPQISRVARTYRSGQVERQELLQEGVVGVLRALERFDAERGVPFWAYAAWWVRQAMQQLVAELTRPLVLSDRALRDLSRLKQAHHAAVQSHGRAPTRAELAAAADMSPEHVEDLLAAERAPVPLDRPATDDDQQLGSFGDLLTDPLAQDAYEDAIARIATEELRRLLSGLSERERQILRLRYGLDGPELSLRQVGARLGLSPERVSQLEHRALAKLADHAVG